MNQSLFLHHIFVNKSVIVHPRNKTKESDFIVVWEAEVQPLTDVQRLIFLSLTIVIGLVAVVGNILVIYVNFSRFEFYGKFNEIDFIINEFSENNDFSFVHV